MDELEKRIKNSLSTYLGYPCNCGYSYADVLKFFNLHINNVGDPNVSGTYRANTKDIELQVLEFFADLWGIKRENVWGYITHSGTEGNLQGLFVGRESACGKPHVFFATKDSHYSIFKIAKLLCLNLCIVQSQANGEMDYHDFEAKLQEHQGKYVIVNANLGTTMKGAMDDTREIYRIIKKHKADCYIHIDGALSGFYLPFIETDLYFKAHVNSMSISGHKSMGVPFPCGVFIMEKRFLKLVSHEIEYMGSVDCMISGSRNGHTPILMQHIIQKKGYDGFRKDTLTCIELAEYLVDHIPNAWRNSNSLTVVIPKPNEEMIKKWQLATEGDISHIVVLPHVTREKLDDFISDLIITNS